MIIGLAQAREFKRVKRIVALNHRIEQKKKVATTCEETRQICIGLITECAQSA